MLIQVLLAESTEQLLEAYEAASPWADLVEFRLDRLRDPDLKALFKHSGKPRISTCRSRSQGGFFPGPEEERQALLEEAVRLGSEYVDLEFESDDEEMLGLSHKSQPILSYHHRGGTPVDLQATYRKMAERGSGAVLKLIPFADSCTDNLRIRSLLQQARDEGRRLIAFCTGERGQVSRILSRAWGSWAVYAPSGVESQTAPGQLLLSDLVELYRYRDLEPTTSLFGILGHPLSQSLSPLVHNHVYAELGLRYRFLPFDAEAVAEFLPLLSELPLLGLAVTHPHKEALLRYCDELSPTAKGVGAVNTVLKRWNRLVGHNTDVEGGLSPLRRRLSLKGAAVGVLGAGGAARALVHGLTRAGSKVIVFARRENQAASLARDLGCRYGNWSAARTFQGQVIVNATPLGRPPGPEGDFFGPRGVRVDWAYDLVYRPAKTSFLAEAERAGTRVISGMEMFLEQALLQFELMTRRTPPREIFERVLAAYGLGDQDGK